MSLPLLKRNESAHISFKIFTNNYIFMKTIYIVIFSLVCQFIKTEECKSQLKRPQTGASITVHVTDKSLYNQPIKLTLVRDYIYGDIGATTYSAKANSEGYFKFKVEDLKNTASLSLEFEGRRFINSYLEPGDDIRCEFGEKPVRIRSENEISFSGQGSEKLQFSRKIQFAVPNNVIEMDQKTNSDDLKIEGLFAKADSLYVFKKRILMRYQKSMGNGVFQRLNADIFGQTYGSMIRMIYASLSDKLSKPVLSKLNSRIRELKFGGSAIEVSQSNDYLSFLQTKGIMASKLVHSPTDQKFQKVYDALVAQNNGIIREKLLLFYFSNSLNSSGSEHPEYVYNSSLQYFSNPKYKDYVSSLSKYAARGSEAYNFKLPNESGKIVSLDDFKGKVIILDFWFTGCNSCSAMAKSLESSVLPVFINSKDLICISINVDRHKNKWLQSVKSGEYTNPKSINLFTEGLALDHPLIQKYHFQGFPQVMLIDRNGKIFSPSLPRDAKGMIETIDKALKTKDI